MKKSVLYIISILSISLLLLNSCRDDDKTLFSYGDDILDGAIVYFEEEPPLVLGVNSVSEVVYGGEIIDPLGNVASYQLEMYASLSGETTDTVLVDIYSSFPFTLSVTTQDLATLLGINTSDINFGDTFYFLGTVTSENGNVYYGEAPEIGDDGSWIPNGKTQIEAFDPTNGYKDAFLFDFTIGCPANSYTAADVVGTWDIVDDPFGASLSATLEIVSGPGENQLTLLDIFGHGYDVIMDVNAETNAIDVAKQESWDTSVFGLPYGIASVEGEGTMFACANTIVLFLDHTVSIGGWGISSFKIQKQ